jgi:hypothetical protein
VAGVKLAKMAKVAKVANFRGAKKANIFSGDDPHPNSLWSWPQSDLTRQNAKEMY